MRKTDERNERRGQRIVRGLAALVVALFASFAALLVLTDLWTFEMWRGLSLDEALFHLSVSASGTNPEIVRSYLWNCCLSVAVVAVVLGITAFVLSEDRHAFRVFLSITAAVSVAALCWAWVDVDQRLSLSSYLGWSGPSAGLSSEEEGAEEADADGSDLEQGISRVAIDANGVHVSFPEARRNLVLIFLESMEITYADSASGGAFEQNLIPELTKLGMTYEDFSGEDSALDGAIPMPGATWTAGALFAQTTGFPLKGRTSYEEGFVPDVRALGDVLADEGYQQMLLIGSEASFGARDLMFTTHGGFDLYDYYRAAERGDIPEGYWVFWGYEDQTLFAIAREQLGELSKGEEPFNLTMLTVDTHFPEGYVCERCVDEHDDQYSNVMSCSSRQVSEYVKWLQEQPFYEDTTIVISGDHLTMAEGFCDEVHEDYVRRTFVCVINPADELAYEGESRVYSTFDLYPTVVAALGAEIPGNRLGLGTNLFSERQTLCEEYGVDKVRELTSSISDVRELFWWKEAVQLGVSEGGYVG